MNTDEVAEIVGRIAHEVAEEPTTDGVLYPWLVFARVRDRHPEVVAHLERQHQGQDPFQMMKVHIPHLRGWTVT